MLRGCAIHVAEYRNIWPKRQYILNSIRHPRKIWVEDTPMRRHSRLAVTCLLALIATGCAAPEAGNAPETGRGGGALLALQAAPERVRDTPFGTVVKACGVSGPALGRLVARSPGPGTFALYDTAPGRAGPRTQFVTGFRDGCPRQITASLALFGTATAHEATRYNPLNVAPYSATDDAYEEVKAKVCGIDPGAFCKGAKARRLARDAAFLSVFLDAGGAGRWMQMFLYKGRLVSFATLEG